MAFGACVTCYHPQNGQMQYMQPFLWIAHVLQAFLAAEVRAKYIPHRTHINVPYSPMAAEGM